MCVCVCFAIPLSVVVRELGIIATKAKLFHCDRPAIVDRSTRLDACFIRRLLGTSDSCHKEMACESFVWQSRTTTRRLVVTIVSCCSPSFTASEMEIYRIRVNHSCGFFVRPPMLPPAVDGVSTKSGDSFFSHLRRSRGSCVTRSGNESEQTNLDGMHG